MPGQPPRDGDDAWNHVFEQVRDGLDALSVFEGETRDAVMEALRQAFGELGTPASEGQGPDISVVEGGLATESGAREGDETARPRPDLRVATHGEGEAAPRPVVAHVKVVRKGAAPAEDAAASLSEGWIHLASEGDHQTVFRGEHARAYRVACTEGSLGLVLDGAPADALLAGQSMDVEARLVRVSAASSPANGRYLRLEGEQ